MTGFVNQISSHYQEQYNDRMNDHQQSLITRFLSRCWPAEEKERETEEDEEIDDIDELPADFDFTGFEDVLKDVREPGPDWGESEEGVSVHMPQ